MEWMTQLLGPNGSEGYGPPVIFFDILLAFALGIIVATVYKRTHTGLSYSQSFVFTLPTLSVIVSVVMMVIGNNLARAFGLVGALSIIRFRTVVKDTKDTAYVFWALAVGMASGTNSYMIAVIGTGLISAIVFLLTRLNFGAVRKHDYVLRFSQHATQDGQAAFQELFKVHLKGCTLLHMNAYDEGRMLEYSYNVRFVDESQSNLLMRDLSALSGVSRVQLITAKNDVEY
ncbi:MAG: DUF4956 domain-containing protein [Deltaproteobacteria bacterium]|nr:DUF4956 domain-containing protein [Deltaproteobacteria bacterium]